MNARKPGFVSSLGHCSQHQTHWRGRSREDSCNSQLHLSSPVSQEETWKSGRSSIWGITEWMNRTAEVSSSKMEMVLPSVENILENKHTICWFKRQAVSITQVPGLCQLLAPALDEVWVGAGIVFTVYIWLGSWNHALSHTCSLSHSADWLGALLFITLLILLLPADLITAEFATQ